MVWSMSVVPGAALNSKEGVPSSFSVIFGRKRQVLEELTRPMHGSLDGWRQAGIHGRGELVAEALLGRGAQQIEVRDQNVLLRMLLMTAVMSDILPYRRGEMTRTLCALRRSPTRSLISVSRSVKCSPVATSPKRNGLRAGSSALRSSITLLAVC